MWHNLSVKSFVYRMMNDKKQKKNLEMPKSAKKKKFVCCKKKKKKEVLCYVVDDCSISCYDFQLTVWGRKLFCLVMIMNHLDDLSIFGP